jgi:hypothetical protein
MANYSYSTPYTGQQVPTLPPGYMEAATAPGRNLAMGIASMGQNIGKAIEQYRTKKADTEAATQSWETVSGMMQQQLSADPKYLAIQQYMDTGALPQGVSEKDIPQFTQKVMADREMLNKFSSLGEKFPDMSLAKKKAALGDAVMVLNQYRNDQSNEVRDAAARQQLAVGALQLSQAKKQAEAAPYLTNALLDMASRKPGQGPTAGYADVTQEMLQKYGNKLTPEMLPQFIQQIQRMNQTLPSGIVPTGATVGPEGTKVEYGLPATPTAIPVAGAPGYFQTMVGGKAVGEIKRIQPQVQARIDELPEAQQKWANDTQKDLMKLPEFTALNEQVKILDEIKELGTTPAADIALIMKYMKALDPTSVVREGEFKTLGNAGSLPTQVQNWYNSYATGNKLTPEVRKEIKSSAESIVRGSINAAQPTIQDIISQAKIRGVPEDAVLPQNTIAKWRSVSQQSQAQTMQRFQSPADMKAAGVTRGLVFNPANGKYSEYIQD